MHLDRDNFQSSHRSRHLRNADHSGPATSHNTPYVFLSVIGISKNQLTKTCPSSSVSKFVNNIILPGVLVKPYLTLLLTVSLLLRFVFHNSHGGTSFLLLSDELEPHTRIRESHSIVPIVRACFVTMAPSAVRCVAETTSCTFPL